MKTLFILLASFAFAYSDPELEQLWNSIPDINHPRLEDFRLIEDYITNGKRPYLDPLRNAVGDNEARKIRLHRICHFKLVGLNNEMPIFEIHRLNECKETNDRCIITFGSHNGKERPYAEYPRKLLLELERIGYSGHALIQIGGFPNLSRGGLKLAHIPYAFKVALFQEAKALGYKEILWLDSEIHPLRDLEMIFTEMKQKGYFLISPGTLQTNAGHFPTEVIAQLHIPPSLYSQIPHIAATVIGLDLSNERASWFLDSWLAETEKVVPNIAFFPEELGLSLVAWRLGCKPHYFFGDILCIGHEIKEMDVFKDRPNLQFYVGNL